MPVIGSVTITPATALYTNLISDSAITASTSTREGRTAIVLDFNSGDGLYARDLGTIFQWPTTERPILDVWQPSVIELPENVYDRASDWTDGNYPGAKFVQGYEIEADSFNAMKNFQLQDSDSLAFHPLNETPVAFNKQSKKFFSCAPFIAHLVRRTSTDGIPWRVFNENIVFEPYPELASLWETELMSYAPGWQHIRMLNIPYIATAAVTLTLTFDQWPTIVIADQLPPTVSQLYPTKQKVTPSINKSKLMGFTLTSPAPFRVFKKMLEVHVGGWGRSGGYELVRPFGGAASDGAEV